MPEQDSSITNTIPVYDSEIPAIEEVSRALRDKQGKNVDLEGFRKEIIGRFEEIGLVVKTRVWSTDVPNCWAFDADICGRTEPHVFDPDRMVHEVTSDLLELGEGGVIKSGLWTPPSHGH